MKERSIICRDDEVRAFLEGRKTQMRRPFVLPKFASHIEEPPKAVFPDGSGLGWIAWYGAGPFSAEDTKLRYPGPERQGFPCPFGVAGDHLWVQETWNMRGIMFGKPAEYARYASRDAYHYRATDDGKWRPEWGGWRSATQMPRVVSRLTLEIVGVRVERLQDITEHDAKAEGVECVDLGHGFLSDARCAFRDAWDHAFGESVDAKTGELFDAEKHPFAWCHNPFVWALNVKVIA